MSKISTKNALRQIYPYATNRAKAKQMDCLDKYSSQFIRLSPFLVMATAQPNGLADASPKGGSPGFVKIQDKYTIAIPDWPGNNRLDTIENILINPAIGLIFFIPGINETLRINGLAEIRDDRDLVQKFINCGKLPKTICLVDVKEIYLHCAKALMRSMFWSNEAQAENRPIPSLGEILKEQIGDEVDVETQADMETRYKKLLY